MALKVLDVRYNELISLDLTGLDALERLMCTGNRKISIIGNGNISVDNNAVYDPYKRRIASWDLTDARGRPVSAGTYLVKGTVRTDLGGRENVSLVIGVRKPRR